MQQPGPRTLTRGQWPRDRLRIGLLPLVGAALLLGLLMVLCRGSALVSSIPMNPDEAELLAEGRRAMLNLSPYVTYTTATYLAIWPMFLGALAKLGVPMALQTAHVLSGLAYVWIALVGWYVISRRLGWGLSAAFVLPPSVALLSGPGPIQGDFLALGTELLPVAIIMLGALVLLGSDNVPSRRRLAFACAIAGLAIWAKPQLGVLALALCAVGLLIRRLQDADPIVARDPLNGWSDLPIVVAAFVVPTVLILLWIVLLGTLPEFIAEPMAIIWSYVSGGGPQGAGAPLLSLWGRVTDAAGFVVDQSMALIWAVPGIIGLASVWKSTSRRGRWILGAIWTVPLAAAVLTLTVTHPMLPLWTGVAIFPHYANIVYAGCALSGMAGCSVAQLIRPKQDRKDQPTKRGRTSSLSRASIGALLVASMLLMLPSVHAIAGNVLRMAYPPAGTTNAEPVSISPIADLCPARSRVLVWGWAAELYATYNWAPASRYVTSWPLSPWGHPETYSATLMREVTAQPPDCVVEAIGVGFFGDLGPSDSIATTMPNLGTYLTRCYDEHHEFVSAEQPVRLWRHNGTCGILAGSGLATTIPL